MKSEELCTYLHEENIIGRKTMLYYHFYTTGECEIESKVYRGENEVASDSRESEWKKEKDNIFVILPNQTQGYRIQGEKLLSSDRILVYHSGTPFENPNDDKDHTRQIKGDEDDGKKDKSIKKDTTIKNSHNKNAIIGVLLFWGLCLLFMLPIMFLVTLLNAGRRVFEPNPVFMFIIILLTQYLSCKYVSKRSEKRFKKTLHI